MLNVHHVHHQLFYWKQPPAETGLMRGVVKQNVKFWAKKTNNKLKEAKMLYRAEANCRDRQ